MDDQQSSALTLYEAVGGASYFEKLVADFYSRVENDPVIRPLYPDDLGPSITHTALFLIQYWGGPATYSQTRGHPRLRMRHAPFKIGQAERNAWLSHMAASVTESDAIAEAKSMMLAYFDNASTAMINSVD